MTRSERSRCSRFLQCALVVALWAATSLFPPPAFSDEPTELEGVTVTATRTAQQTTDVPASVSVINRTKIEQSPVLAIDDLLRGVMGVQIRRNSSLYAHPTGQSIGIRGAGNNRALVLVDGVPLNDGFAGWIWWNKVSPSMVGRIEVLRGGESALYGSYAMGGVISLFTRRPKTPIQSFTYEEGNLGNTHASGLMNQPLGQWLLTVATDLLHTDGYLKAPVSQRGPAAIPASGTFRSTQAVLRGPLGPRDDLQFSGTFYSEDRNGGRPLLNMIRTSQDFSATWTRKGRVAGSKFTAALFTSTNFFRNNIDQGATKPTLINFIQYIPVVDRGFSLVWTQPVGAKHLITAGGDGRYVQATNWEEGAAGVFQTAATGRQLTTSLFLQDEYRPNPADLWQVSLRADQWKNFDAASITPAGAAPVPARDSGAITPRIGYHRTLSKNASWYASYGTSFRAPTLNELYRRFVSGPITFNNNPNLAPERGQDWEVGFERNFASTLRLTSALFHNSTSDLIVFVTQNATNRLRQNVGLAETTGWETALTWAPDDHWAAGVQWTAQHAAIVSFPTNRALEGKNLPQTPESQYGLSLGYTGKSGWQVGLQGNYFGDSWDDDLNTVKLPATFLVNFKATYPLGPDRSLTASVENLTNQGYLTSSTELGPPRTARLGLNWKI